MQVPILPVVVGGIVLTFAVAVLGWWVASRVERRRAARRDAQTARRRQEQGGARPPDGPASDGSA